MIKHRKITHHVESLFPTLVKQIAGRSEVEVLYLYGSRASDRISPLSDVDLAVLVSSQLSRDRRFDLRMTLIGLAMEILRTDEVDLQILNELPVQAQYAILKNRKVLFSRDNFRRIDFESAVVSRYLDFKSFLEEQYEAMHKRIEDRALASSR